MAGHDFHETFAPTAKFKSICIVLNLAAIFGWDIHGLDIENAFLESDLEKTIYMQQPIDKASRRTLFQADEMYSNISRTWYEMLYS